MTQTTRVLYRRPSHADNLVHPDFLSSLQVTPPSSRSLPSLLRAAQPLTQRLSLLLLLLALHAHLLGGVLTAPHLLLFCALLLSPLLLALLRKPRIERNRIVVGTGVKLLLLASLSPLLHTLVPISLDTLTFLLLLLFTLHLVPPLRLTAGTAAAVLLCTTHASARDAFALLLCAFTLLFFLPPLLPAHSGATATLAGFATAALAGHSRVGAGAAAFLLAAAGFAAPSLMWAALHRPGGKVRLSGDWDVAVPRVRGR